MKELSNSVTVEPPRITQLVGSDGSNIDEGSSNTYVDVTLKGTAEAARVVEVFDNGNFIALASVASGVWALDLPGLSSGSHVFIARYYDGQLSSNEWRYTVATAQGLTISSIKETATGSDIPANGMTFTAGVTLSGEVPAGQPVEIFDGSTSLGRATVIGSTWTLTRPGLNAKTYNIRARGLYGSNPESSVRSFTCLPNLELFLAHGAVDSIPSGTRLEYPTLIFEMGAGGGNRVRFITSSNVGTYGYPLDVHSGNLPDIFSFRLTFKALVSVLNLTLNIEGGYDNAKVTCFNSAGVAIFTGVYDQRVLNLTFSVPGNSIKSIEVETIPPLSRNLQLYRLLYLES